jgi:hypothetical protein
MSARHRTYYRHPDDWGFTDAPTVLRPRDTTDWSKRRLKQTDIELSLQLVTRCWLDDLPEDVVPHALAAKYARIANRMARLWDQPQQMLPYFEDLRVDKRGGRKGFPPEVLTEIDALFEYYKIQHGPHPPAGSGKDAWETEPDRHRRGDDSGPIRW